MTLDQIAKDMGTDREALSSHILGRGNTGSRQLSERRQFVHRAFTEGHTPEAIGEYLDRSQTMVLHALRMTCVDEMGAPYGQTLAEIKYRLTGEAA